MINYFKRIFSYKRVGLYFETIVLEIDEIKYKYDVAFKVRELNKFNEDSLVRIVDVFSMDRKPLSEYIKHDLFEKAPKVINTNKINWEN